MKLNYQISFEGQNLYIGIDVHLRSWNYTIITESGFQETRTANASVHELYRYLCNHYQGASYLAVYETGFSGYSAYYALSQLGIHCIIVYAADVPTPRAKR